MSKIIHGIDMTNINRSEYNNESLVKKILHTNELNKYINLEDELIKKRYLASRWSIKESLYKCHQFKCTFKDILIEYNSEIPFILLDGIYFSVSVSYEGDLVISSVFASID